jgi:hypothetical protein
MERISEDLGRVADFRYSRYTNLGFGTKIDRIFIDEQLNHLEIFVVGWLRSEAFIPNQQGSRAIKE